MYLHVAWFGFIICILHDLVYLFAWFSLFICMMHGLVLLFAFCMIKFIYLYVEWLVCMRNCVLF
jgi:hypothetical protein